MSGADKIGIEFSNCALIQDETLLTICLVLEGGWPAGPTFLHALNTLIEAVVVHEKVYFDPLHQLERANDSPNSVPSILRKSGFVGLLMQEGALRKFPNESEVNEYLLARGREYSYTNFVVEAYWSVDSFAYGEPADEANRIGIYLDLVSKAARLLEPREITPFMKFRDPVQGEVSLMEPDALKAQMLANRIDLGQGDLKIIEGLNFRTKALLDLTLNTGLHLHPFYLALPHQIGAIRSHNSQALKLIRSIQDKVGSMDGSPQELGQSSFTRSPIPALTEVVLSRCKDSPKAIALEVLELRAAHRDFRDYLTKYEQKWNHAQTKRERWKLEREFEDAIKLTFEREARPSNRLIYTLWDIVKEPTKALQAVGDKLVKRGREEQIVGRVKGLHDFWRDLANAPPSDVARAQFNRLFSKRSDDRTWDLGQQLAEAVNTSLTRGEDS
jgi:hypothetical protein